MMSFVNTALCGLLLFGIQIALVDACSRVVYKSKYGYFTARSMDWFEDTDTYLWTFPVGMERNGNMGENSLEWTSKYGSVVASAYGLAAMDGINTEGLVANMLYLVESDYGSDNADREGQKKLSIGGRLQYMLDMHSTVKEVVDAFKDDDINVVAPPLPTDPPKAAAGHIAISDESGDSAIFEFLDGTLYINHSPDYTVMTNSPRFEQQLSISAYFEDVGGLSFLPGTHRAADRFVRLVYNVNAMPEVEDLETSVATVMSLIRHISVPYGVMDPNKPNLSSTIWRTVYNHKDRIMYYENVLSPSLFWINLSKVDLTKETGKVMKLSYMGVYLSGESSAAFVESEPFTFLGKHSEHGAPVAPTGCAAITKEGECNQTSGCIHDTTCRDAACTEWTKGNKCLANDCLFVKGAGCMDADTTGCVIIEKALDCNKESGCIHDTVCRDAACTEWTTGTKCTGNGCLWESPNCMDDTCANRGMMKCKKSSDCTWMDDTCYETASLTCADYGKRTPCEAAGCTYARKTCNDSAR